MAASENSASPGVLPVEPLVSRERDQVREQERPAAPDRARVRRRPWPRLLLWTVVVIAVLLVGARLVAPLLIASALNDRLEESDGYTGTIADVDLGVFGGWLAIDHLRLHSVRGAQADAVAVDCRCPHLVFDGDWGTVFAQSVLGELRIEDPEVTLRPTVDAAEPGEGADRHRAVRGALALVLPISCREVQVTGGTLRLVTERQGHRIDLAIEDLAVEMEGLEALGEGRGSDRPPAARDPQPAVLNASARITGTSPGGGDLAIAVAFATASRRVDARVDARWERFDLTALNDLLRAYGDLDVERGTASLFSEFSIRDGSYEGYVKFLTWNLDIFSWKDDQREGLGDAFYEALVGAGAELLENQGEDQQGVRIPLEGDLADADMDLSAAIVSVLRNAFVQAMLPGFGEQAE